MFETGKKHVRPENNWRGNINVNKWGWVLLGVWILVMVCLGFHHIFYNESSYSPERDSKCPCCVEPMFLTGPNEENCDPRF